MYKFSDFLDWSKPSIENTFNVSEEFLNKMLEVITERPKEDNILKELFERIDDKIELNSVNEVALATMLVVEAATLHKKFIDESFKSDKNYAFLNIIESVYNKLN